MRFIVGLSAIYFAYFSFSASINAADSSLACDPSEATEMNAAPCDGGISSQGFVPSLGESPAAKVFYRSQRKNTQSVQKNDSKSQDAAKATKLSADKSVSKENGSSWAIIPFVMLGVVLMTVPSAVVLAAKYRGSFKSNRESRRHAKPASPLIALVQSQSHSSRKSLPLEESRPVRRAA